ncbi:MAG: glycerophosphodiester phosphodiesterase [Defluviitaleaceae bacterium]|nr:glycerophosphodiester phosphodiesterase [Defluviitaleaceae bacterium]
MQKTKIYAHRGSRGTKNEYPENTMLAFQKAIEHKADGIELDVHLSRDEHVIVIHDEDLDRTTDGTGFVRNHPLDELKEFDAGQGEKIPTLQEVFELLSGTSLELNIELKTNRFPYPKMPQKLLDMAKKMGESRKIIYSSFHLPTLLTIKKLDNTAKIAWLLESGIIANPERAIKASNLDALHITPTMFLPYLHRFEGLVDKIRIYTVNDAVEIRELAKIGIDAVITDVPDVAREVLGA